MARNLTLVIALVALALLACWPSAAALWDLWVWNRYVDGHGPVIVAISLALLVRSRHALAGADVRPSVAGAAGLFACGLAWLSSLRTGSEVLPLLLLPVILLVAVFAAFGRKVAAITAFPIGYLYFAEPVGHVLIGPLQSLTTRVVGAVVPLLGMPVTVAGNILIFSPSISFEVTPICGGVNFLVVGLAAAALIGELQQASFRRRTLQIAAMALLMMVSNWVRVLVIIVAGYSTDMRSLLATRGHWYLGWILFALVMFGFARVSAGGSRSASPAP